MLAYVYGVVPLSLCRNGACGGGGGGGSNTNERNAASTFRDEEGAYGERILLSEGERIKKNNKENSTKTTKSSFHQRRQSIASFGKWKF